MLRLTCLSFLISLAFCISSFSETTKPLNVLFIAIDDLRLELGAYGADHIHSPNIDRFAADALVFDRAYCQQAVCNPSRSSLMTGLRPDEIGVTGNHVHFRDNLPDVVTLPQYFMNHGYDARAIGKIYHGYLPEGTSKTVWDTMGDAQSWSVPATRFGPRYYYTDDGIRQARKAYIDMYRPEGEVGEDDWQEKLVFGPMTEAPNVGDNVLHDGKVADASIEALQNFASNPEQPFFLAMGFIKPHTPFVAPKKYWDLYDRGKIEIATERGLPKGAPKYAGHRSGEVRRYTDQPNRAEFTVENQRKLRHGYYACISYVDAQLGRVLDELDRLGMSDNTVVLLFSDHGWHLGEKGLWGKTTNYELDTNAPLIVRAPEMKASGKRTKALVEYIDFYPTLSDLAGIPAPSNRDGRSFAPLLHSPRLKWKDVAISQYSRGGNADFGGKTMGYSMRTDRWRYVEWVDRKTALIVDQELYDHENDSAETVNVALSRKYKKILKNLSKQLRSTIEIAPR